MNAQQSGALSLASITLQLTLLDTLVEKGLLKQEEVPRLLLRADTKLAGSPAMEVTRGFLAALRRARGGGASAGFALALSADRDPQRSVGGFRTDTQRWEFRKGEHTRLVRPFVAFPTVAHGPAAPGSAGPRRDRKA